jgi:hypothetical protein
MVKRTDPSLYVVEPGDIDRIAEDIIGEVESEVRSLARLPKMPDYVTHDPEVDYVGKLTSEALVMSYEATAKQIEAMGQGLVEGVRECERSALEFIKELERTKQETEEAVKQCLAAAEVYREQARELFKQIQSRAMLAAKVRETASAMIDDLKK